jgi:hypothetical protein
LGSVVSNTKQKLQKMIEKMFHSNPFLTIEKVRKMLRNKTGMLGCCRYNST